MSEVTTKKCSSCRREKDFSEFYKMKVGTHGLDHYCIVCRKEKNREYELKNRMKRNAYMAHWRAVKAAEKKGK